MSEDDMTEAEKRTREIDAWKAKMLKAKLSSDGYVIGEITPAKKGGMEFEGEDGAGMLRHYLYRGGVLFVDGQRVEG